MKKTQHGAALLLAMLTVALVATLASAALWQQWRGTEVEQAERERLQAGWILNGALDWARLILREDARTNQNTGAADHLGEPWAVGLQEAKLSSFLAADKGQDPPAELEAFLSGAMEDLQGRLNITNLVANGKASEADVQMFERLYKQLALPPDELSRVTQALVLARQALSGQLTSAAAGMPLAPQRIAQLGWLGMSEASISRLQPYITVLPERTTVNINTATAEVLAAAIDGLDMGRARRIVQQRALQPFKTLADARTVLGSQVTLLDSAHSTTTRYFEVLGRLRLGERVVQERSLLVRNGLEVKVLWRERTAAVMPLPGTAGALTPK